jgi:hypothetical protein
MAACDWRRNLQATTTPARTVMQSGSSFLLRRHVNRRLRRLAQMKEGNQFTRVIPRLAQRAEGPRKRSTANAKLFDVIVARRVEFCVSRFYD